MAPRITHICLHVANLEECVAFYRHYCDLSIIRDDSAKGEGSVYVGSPGDDSALAFQLMSGGHTQDLLESDNRHFGFEVESKERVDEIASRARADGCLFWEPEEYLPSSYICGVKDPNGNCLEFGVGHPVPPP